MDFELTHTFDCDLTHFETLFLDPAYLQFLEKTVPNIAKIEVLEKEQSALTAQLADPAFFRQAGPAVGQATTRLAEIERQLATVYERWTELGG